MRFDLLEGDWDFWHAVSTTETLPEGAASYFLTMLIRRALVVRDMDLTRTLFLADNGDEVASKSGLKLRMVETILLATVARVLMSEPKLFKVAVTSNASLQYRKSEEGHKASAM